MELVTFKRWQLLVDRKATQEAYATIPNGGSDGCKCLYCRNFAATRDSIYPAEFRALLNQLGIDYLKEVEVWEAGVNNARKRLYSGWFHFVGKIVSVNKRKASRQKTHSLTPVFTEEFDPIGDTFALSFSKRRDMSCPAFEEQSIVQLTFIVEVPWFLDEQPGY